MAFFRKMLQRLFGWFGHRAGQPEHFLDPEEADPRASQSEDFMDPDEAKRLGYRVTPGGLQWSPGPRQPVDKSRWKPCDSCSRLIPVIEDWVGRIVEVRTAGQRTGDPDGTIIEEGVTYPIYDWEPAGTWTYVCPFCGHCHVGTPGDSPDLRAQMACHECGTDLGSAFQCPKCSFPRGWMTVQCPNCGNRQPVNAPHWVVCCDMFTLECVKCESVFESLCIC
jgi:hypothetical protein